MAHSHMHQLPAGKHEVFQYFDTCDPEWVLLAKELPEQERTVIEAWLEKLYWRLSPEQGFRGAVGADDNDALDVRLFLRGEGPAEQQVWIEAPRYYPDKPFEAQDLLALDDMRLIQDIDIYVMETVAGARRLRRRVFAETAVGEMRALLAELHPRDGLSWREMRDKFQVWRDSGEVGQRVHSFVFEQLVPRRFASLLYLAEVGEIIRTFDAALFHPEQGLQMRGAAEPAVCSLSLEDWLDLQAGLEDAFSKAGHAFPARLSAVREYLSTELCL